MLKASGTNICTTSSFLLAYTRSHSWEVSKVNKITRFNVLSCGPNQSDSFTALPSILAQAAGMWMASGRRSQKLK